MQLRITLGVHGEAVNAAQGTLHYDPSAVQVVSIRTGGSLFRFWPVSPAVDRESGTITFTGGLPTPGFAGSDALLFTVNIIPLKAGTFPALTWDASSQVLLNDGAGSPATVQFVNADLHVTSATAAVCIAPRQTPLVAADTTPPEPFDVVITRTPNAYDGRYFASFYAYDAGSGISRYDVQENGAKWQTATSPYVLHQQTGDVVLFVRAIDVAGNARTASASLHVVPSPVPSGTHPFGPWWFWLIALFAALAGIGRILSMRHHVDTASQHAMEAKSSHPDQPGPSVRP